MDLLSSFKHQVNGSMLVQFHGKSVSIFGTVMKTNPNGLAFDIKTSDSMVVTVNLKERLTESVDGLVEVQGVGQGRNSILCDYYIMFPNDLGSTYDAELDNNVALLVNSVANPWKTN